MSGRGPAFLGQLMDQSHQGNKNPEGALRWGRQRKAPQAGVKPPGFKPWLLRFLTVLNSLTSSRLIFLICEMEPNSNNWELLLEITLTGKGRNGEDRIILIPGCWTLD